MLDGKRVFISYSHDSDPHKDWVLDLATFLREKGLDVYLDQWDLDFGDDLVAFMERSIKGSDRVLVICTDQYIEKANAGKGGVGYEKTIVTAEILRDPKIRRKFIPVVRNVEGEEKMPVFFGSAYFADLSDGNDGEEIRNELVRRLNAIPIKKPAIGASPFLSEHAPHSEVEVSAGIEEWPSLNGEDVMITFASRFSFAFPGVRGIEWIEDEKTIAERLKILLKAPLAFREGHLMWWWRGPENLQIDRFEHVEGSHYLMNICELNIKKIAAVCHPSYYRKFIYVETSSDEPTGLYDCDQERLTSRIEEFGYVCEEYGLVDETFPVTREEYDDGAAIVGGEHMDIRGRADLRVRYISPFNFLIAPNGSPINNSDFDEALQKYLEDLLIGKNVFGEMCEAIQRLPKRN